MDFIKADARSVVRCVKLHGLDASAKNFRTEDDRFIDVFLEHQWCGPHKKREADAFLQSWNMFIANVLNVGMEAWFQKLYASRNRFEKRRVSGACYRLHRLSRETGLFSLSWGDPCSGCLSTRQEHLRRRTSLLSPGGGLASLLRCVKGLLLCNPFTSSLGARFLMVLHHRMFLVVLLYKAGNVGH